MKDLSAYQFHSFPGPEASETDHLVKGVSTVFSHSFGENPKTKKPYRLGPKTTRERLSSTNHLFAAQASEEMVGYLYSRTLDSGSGSIAWIDSLAVLPLHRRRGVATRLVEDFISKVSGCRWVGCATPNPVAAFVITRAVRGTTYVEGSHPPQEIISMIEDIRPKCPDLRGTDFNPTRLLVKTQFTPVKSEDTTEWKPPHPSEPPPWWASLENLPDDYEALIIIDRGRSN